jgi:NAD/NADP transhydrogenase beta subunit
MSTTTRIGTAVAAGSGMATLPALVATGHPWIGAAGLVISLGAWVLHSRQVARGELAQDQAVLSYAHTSVSLGVDPAPVIVAMRGRADEPVDPPRDDGVPAVRGLHLPPDCRR